MFGVDKKATKSKAPRRGGILTLCWKHGRHFFCRYGLYPLAVAPLLTAACLMSIYSSTGCKFVNVDVGFTPTPNVAWNESTSSLGFWYHYRPDLDYDVESGNPFDVEFLDTVHNDECQWYADDFEDKFIDTDRTWKVARIMAMVAACGSMASAFLAWTFVGPFFCPVGFLWPGILLPLVMISFIAEGSKFLIFDMGICRNAIFFPQGEENAVPESVHSCKLGESAILGTVAGGLLLIALLMVCLHVPNERKLDPEFGIPSGDTDPSEEGDGVKYRSPVRPIPPAQKSASQQKSSSRRRHQQQLDYQKNMEEQKRVEVHDIEKAARDDASVLTDHIYDDEYSHNRYGRPPRSSKGSSFTSSRSSKRDRPYTSGPFSVGASMDSSLATNSLGLSSGNHSRNYCIDELIDEKDEEINMTMNSALGSIIASSDMDEIRISESRLSTLASVEEKAAGSSNLSVASSMLEDLVRDLDSSYSYSHSISGRISPTLISRHSHFP